MRFIIFFLGEPTACATFFVYFYLENTGSELFVVMIFCFSSFQMPAVCFDERFLFPSFGEF